MKKIIIYLALALMLIAGVYAATIPMRYSLDFYGLNGIFNVTTITANEFIGDGSGLTGISTGTIGGSGALNFVPKFSSTFNLTLSGITDDGVTVTFGNGTTKLNISNVSSTEVRIDSGYNKINFTVGNLVANINFSINNILTADGTNDKITIPRTVRLITPTAMTGYYLNNFSWYTGTFSGNSFGNATITANALRCYAVDLGASLPFDAIGFSSYGTTSESVTVGIYSDSGNYGSPYPTTLIYNWTSPATSSGFKNNSGLSYAFQENKLYYRCYWTNSTTNTYLTLSNAANQDILGYGGAGGTVRQTGFTTTLTYNTSGMPTTYPAGATYTTSDALAIFFRARTDITGTLI